MEKSEFICTVMNIKINYVQSYVTFSEIILYIYGYKYSKIKLLDIYTLFLLLYIIN